MDLLTQFIEELKVYGCKKCNLGFQPGLNGCCVSRGSHLSKRMIIGEAPGKNENIKSKPFIGKAGQLLDKMFTYIGFDIDKDFYITNCVLCRPIAEEGSGKENLTPTVEQRKRCRPYLDKQMELIQPNIIVTLGKIATESVLNIDDIRMTNYHGKEIKKKGYTVFPLYHPAYLLYNGNDENKYNEMIVAIKKIKEFAKKGNI